MAKLSHIDKSGKAVMVDVGSKPVQQRMARAEGFIRLQPETVRLVRENEMKKGDVLGVAQVAGIQAAKRNSDLIPLCHPLMLNKVDVHITLGDEGARAESLVRCDGKTGVEMEALMAVSVALLTVYDMCKAVDKKMVIENIRLIEKVKKDL